MYGVILTQNTPVMHKSSPKAEQFGSVSICVDFTDLLRSIIFYGCIRSRNLFTELLLSCILENWEYIESCYGKRGFNSLPHNPDYYRP